MDFYRDRVDGLARPGGSGSGMDGPVSRPAADQDTEADALLCPGSGGAGVPGGPRKETAGVLRGQVP